MNDNAHPVQNYWKRFKEEFILAISKTDMNELRNAWKSRKERTIFYKNAVLPKMASALEMELKPELFRRDFAMRVISSNEQAVPLIFIESENVALKSNEEMEKLCAVCAPLRVLITVVEWDEKLFPKKGKRKKLIEKWQEIIAAHGEIWPQPGIVGIIVAEWCDSDNHLRFYALGFDPCGNICDEEHTMFDKNMEMEENENASDSQE